MSGRPSVQAAGGDLIGAVEHVADIAVPPEPASIGALQQATSDVSQTIGDVTAQTGVTTSNSNPTTESKGINNIVQASGAIRIIFKRP